MGLTAIVYAVCDNCGKQQTEGIGYEETVYLPDGWYRNVKTGKVYHSEACLTAPMTADELMVYKKGVWVA